MSLIRKEFQYGDNKVTIETGEIARQADGAIMIDMDGTVVQVTVVTSKETVEGRDFFPFNEVRRVSIRARGIGNRHLLVDHHDN